VTWIYNYSSPYTDMASKLVNKIKSHRLALIGALNAVHDMNRDGSYNNHLTSISQILFHLDLYLEEIYRVGEKKKV